MKVKSKIVARYGDRGRLKAVATVCLDGKFLITGVHVSDCRKGLTVFMPSREIRTGEYRDICFPITSELYKKIRDSVLEAYSHPENDCLMEADAEGPEQTGP
jgi:stage V sporulation protein G